MNQIPDLIGYSVELAIKKLKEMGFQANVKETLGRNTIKTEDARVLRQTRHGDQVELIISYF